MDVKKYLDQYLEAVNIIKKSDNEISFIKNKMSEAISNDKHIYFIGNGGSAADCEHWACELVVKFKKIRKGIPATNLISNMSIISAIGNDYSADIIFERQVDTFCKKGDLLIALTTSGRSKNLINAALKAKEKGCYVIGLLGRDGGELKNIADYSLTIPLKSTGCIQVCHSVIYHIICELIDDDF